MPLSCMKFFFFALFFFPSWAGAKRPNILFILVDDLGINDLSIEGSSYYETPNIDRLAREGMRFLNGYSTCQVCSPSRASIVTGQYPARLGITDWIGAKTGEQWNRNDQVLPAANRESLPHEKITIAEALKSGGYRTFYAGKWHLGGKGSEPQDHGFEINKGGYHAGSPRGGYYAPYKNPHLTDGVPGESLPMRLAKETSTFIQEPSEQPFFAFLSFYSVHSPLQTTSLLWKKYRDKSSKNAHVGERFLIDRTLPVRKVQDCPLYAGMMETLDQAVGEVLQTLADSGLEKHTIVIFTSDNGGVSSGDAYSTSCLPLRGGKGRQWEGGIKQPYYIKAPGVTQPGTTTPVLATGTDFFPTLLELAQLPLMPGHHLDGVSLLSALRGEQNTVGERPLFWHYPHYGNQGGEPSSIVRLGEYKLIRYYEDQRQELYHLGKDPAEKNDLAGKEAAQLAQLSDLLTKHLKEMKALHPKPDSRFNAPKKKKHWQRVHTKMKEKLETQHAAFHQEDFRPNRDWWGSQVVKD